VCTTKRLLTVGHTEASIKHASILRLNVHYVRKKDAGMMS